MFLCCWVVQHRLIWIVIGKMFINQSFTKNKAVINGKTVQICWWLSQPRFTLSKNPSGKYEANDRGLKILDFINFFNLCPVNLLSTSCGPLETFVAHSGRYKSILDYILLPNCLFDSIIFCKSFDKSIDNTSDHLPVMLKIEYYLNSRTWIIMMQFKIMLLNPKLRGQVFLKKKLITTIPLN